MLRKFPIELFARGKIDLYTYVYNRRVLFEASNVRLGKHYDAATQ